MRLGLRRFAQAMPGVGRRVLKGAITRARNRARKYPPELPNQRYRRTGRYGRSFQIEARPQSAAAAFGYTISNDASYRGRGYAKYVGGDAEGGQQARIHAGRWLTIRAAVEDELRAILDEIRAGLSEVLRREGIGL